MSNRSGFLEGIIVGGLLAGLSILLAAPKARVELKEKLDQFKDGNEEFIETGKETTEELIEKTKYSIEKGFEKLNELINDNKKVVMDDSVDVKPKKSSK